MFVRHSLCICFVLMATGIASAWTTPVPVSELNTSYQEVAPFLSADGKTLYYSHNTASTPVQLYQATRPQPTGAFTQITQISGTNSGGATVGAPWVSEDNLRMYYHLITGSGGSIWTTKFSQRDSVNDTWPAGSTISGLTGFNIASPSLSNDELTIVFTSDKSGGMGLADIYMATRTDRNSAFGNITNLTTVNSINDEIDPFLSFDGLSIYFTSGLRSQSATVSLYEATRASVTDPFGNVQQISFSDTLSNGIRHPTLSADGSTLYFDCGADLYVSYVPEPATMMLLGLGGVLLRSRKR